MNFSSRKLGDVGSAKLPAGLDMYLTCPLTGELNVELCAFGIYLFRGEYLQGSRWFGRE